RFGERRNHAADWESRGAAAGRYAAGRGRERAGTRRRAAHGRHQTSGAAARAAQTRSLRPASQFTDKVMPAWLGTPPIVTTSGTVGPGVTLEGITTLICVNPSTASGAAPL